MVLCCVSFADESPVVTARQEWLLFEVVELAARWTAALSVDTTGVMPGDGAGVVGERRPAPGGGHPDASYLRF